MKCKIPDRDLAQRLDHTFCRYRGVPYYVRYYDADMLQLNDINSKKQVSIIKSDDPEFDVSSIPLGYMQMDVTRVLYLYRQPSRLFKQGLSLDNIGIYQPYQESRLRASASGVSFFSKAFIRCLEGVYEPLDIAIEFIKTYTADCQKAIDRDVALISKEGNPRAIFVHYKNKEVGWIPKNQKVVIVPSNEDAWIISKYLSNYNWEVR